ncbi:MAG: UDP-N-acetylmuramate dehydrogenase [Pseudobutyrivibrio sp.]|nr:UDP-N-acetylmuramate dehydrogenase [Pseudobutyrivibrio sp.]
MLKNNYIKLSNELKNKFPNSVIYVDEPMKAHTTFRIGGVADVYVEPDYDDIVPMISFLGKSDAPFMVIGNGSNLLVSDDGIEGVVISLGKQSDEITIEGDIVSVQAGALLSKVSNKAAAAGLTGLEFASGIPGSIGGAVYMNAGAYGGEIKDILISAQVLTKDHEVVDMSPEELELSYRHSILMEEGGYVLSAKLKLQAGDSEAITARIDEIRQMRTEKQPLNYPSAGSTFKRPEGYFAGKLIDDAGLRGYTVGGAQVSEKHCGFVINRESATASDVLQLMRDVDDKVYDLFGVHLEPEVRIIGRNLD